MEMESKKTEILKGILFGIKGHRCHVLNTLNLLGKYKSRFEIFNSISLSPLICFRHVVKASFLSFASGMPDFFRIKTDERF
jgi:hypothetical protein